MPIGSRARIPKGASFMFAVFLDGSAHPFPFLAPRRFPHRPPNSHTTPENPLKPKSLPKSLLRNGSIFMQIPTLLGGTIYAYPPYQPKRTLKPKPTPAEHTPSKATSTPKPIPTMPVFERALFFDSRSDSGPITASGGRFKPRITVVECLQRPRIPEYHDVKVLNKNQFTIAINLLVARVPASRWGCLKRIPPCLIW